MTSATPAVGEGPSRRGALRAGERVQLTDAKGRMHTITLTPGQLFFTHRGSVQHDDIVGLPDGSTVRNTIGIEYLVLRPLLSDYVMSMPRGAQVVYPKDAGQIVAMADIFPGAHVVEAGVGSGALSLSLLRAVGESGRLHSFERREDFAQIARANVRAFLGGEHPGWTVTVGDLVEALPGAVEPGTVDRVVLDMLAPWECLPVVADALVPGGVVICYVATATQLSRTAETMRESGVFTEPSAWESLVRGWHLEGLAVRPQHRMHGHTGFLLTARRLAPGVTPPLRKRRPAKGAFPVADDELNGAPTGSDIGASIEAGFGLDVRGDVQGDVQGDGQGDIEADVTGGGAGAGGPDEASDPAYGGDAWSAEALGERPISDRKVRRLARRLTGAAEPTAGPGVDAPGESEDGR